MVPATLPPRPLTICSKLLSMGWRLNSVERGAAAAFNSSKIKLTNQRKRCVSRTMSQTRCYPRPSCSTSLPKHSPLKINSSLQMTADSTSLTATGLVPRLSPRPSRPTGMALISRRSNIRRKNNSYFLHWCSINNSTLSTNFKQS